MTAGTSEATPRRARAKSAIAGERGRDYDCEAHAGGGDGSPDTDHAALPEPVNQMITSESPGDHGDLHCDEHQPGDGCTASDLHAGRARPGRDSVLTERL